MGIKNFEPFLCFCLIFFFLNPSKGKNPVTFFCFAGAPIFFFCRLDGMTLSRDNKIGFFFFYYLLVCCLFLSFIVTATR